MGASYKLSVAELDDIPELDANMRPADRAEIVASHGADTLLTLRRAVRLSTHCFTARARDGRLLAILGTAPLSMVSGHGSPWMLGTEAINSFPRPLARSASWYLAEVAQVYAVLENYVDVRNTASIRLLKWLGCSFDEPQPYGVAGLPFMRFEVRSG